MTTIQKKIKEYRNSKAFTIAEFSIFLDVSLRMQQNIENGHCMISINYFEKLVKKLKLTEREKSHLKRLACQWNCEERESYITSYIMKNKQKYL